MIKFVKNTLLFNYTKAWAYANNCNSKSWCGFNAYIVKCNDWRGDVKEDNSLVYYENTLEFELQTPDWTIQLLNKGSYGWSNDGKHSKVTQGDVPGSAAASAAGHSFSMPPAPR